MKVLHLVVGVVQPNHYRRKHHTKYSIIQNTKLTGLMEIIKRSLLINGQVLITLHSRLKAIINQIKGHTEVNKQVMLRTKANTISLSTLTIRNLNLKPKKETLKLIQPYQLKLLILALFMKGHNMFQAHWQMYHHLRDKRESKSLNRTIKWRGLIQ